MKTPGKNRNTMIIAGGAAALVIAAFLLACIGLSTEGYRLPEDYVNKNSNESANGILVTNIISRLAVKANITSLDLSNRNLTVGVASQTDELNFGNLPQNITMRKFLKINNAESGPFKVCIVKRGDVAEHMFVKPGGSMIINGKDHGEIEVNFNATDVRTYSGEIDIVMRKPKYSILSPLTSMIGC